MLLMYPGAFSFLFLCTEVFALRSGRKMTLVRLTLPPHVFGFYMHILNYIGLPADRVKLARTAQSVKDATEISTRAPRRSLSHLSASSTDRRGSGVREAQSCW
ncbi:hypothetical protein EDC04DRAFT_149869 [Pisolithus marmoratus]|nr:hypothetical protein EDC04DRAFT_149869 [Pisolithus marmoratus]